MQLGVLLLKIAISYLGSLNRVFQAALEIAVVVSMLFATFLFTNHLLVILVAQASFLVVLATYGYPGKDDGAPYQALAQPRKEFLSEFRALMMV